MAIYTRWGNEVTIVGYCGKHQPEWASGKMVLVKIRYAGDTDSFAFAHTLKADGGWDTINKAVDAAPAIELNGDDLKAALKIAE